MTVLNIQDKITVLADAVLGTDAEEATVLEVHDWGYAVSLDSDPEFVGHVDFDGNPLQTNF